MCYISTQSVPRCKHSAWVIKANHLMLHKADVAVRPESHTEHINDIMDNAIVSIETCQYV
jgi:hypothetical protein